MLLQNENVNICYFVVKEQNLHNFVKQLQHIKNETYEHSKSVIFGFRKYESRLFR